MSGGSAGGFDADPPYYAVIFTSRRMAGDDAAYGDMAARMIELAATQPGFLGFDSAREGVGITVSYWRDEDSIAAWRRDVEHRLAQRAGRERWYADFSVRVARVERAYGFSRNDWRNLHGSSGV
ncbi:MAG TPA: antibiotic biosynthesis monooxygenase [Sphingobium sp.]|uniref:antibiotic biosynthesis monooxygenase family protein n=1 Tax=Sphingobium sp. TaxID=1912891 RepID=UPI002ED5025F